MVWGVKKLGDVCDILDNKRKPITKKHRVAGEFPYYGATGILDYVHEYIFDEKLILIGEDGAKWERGDNTSFIVNGKYWVNNHAHVIRPHRDIIMDEWIVYFLNSSDLTKYATGLTVPKLNQEKLRSITLPVPTLQIQKQIVAILDKAFEKISKAKENTEQNLENAKEVFESYLQSVFENKGEGWEEKKLGELTLKIGSGATPKGGQASYKDIGTSLIRSMNVYDEGFKKKNLAFIDDNQASKLNNVNVQEQDVLLNITGGSVARCCIVPLKYLPARVNQHVSIIRVKKNVLIPNLLHYILISKENKNKLLGIGELGATRQAITKTQIENFKITYPSKIDEQNELLNNIRFFKTKSLALGSIYSQKLQSLEELKQSILQKAFAGELTC